MNDQNMMPGMMHNMDHEMDHEMMDDMMMAVPRPMVGYAYVPPQMMKETYTPEKGLERGTIFPQLDIPMEKYGNQYEE